MPETDEEKEEKKRKEEELKMIAESILIAEETGEPLERIKERLLLNSRSNTASNTRSLNNNSGSLLNSDINSGNINGKGISFKPDERPLLGPISPYFRHLTRQSLREAQRHYREHERLRPCSKLEVAHT